MESNFTDQFKEQINNLSLLLNSKNKEIKNKNNIINANDDKYNHSLTNNFDSINFYKNKKDPGSSLLMSSIYSDLNQDLIDESFGNNVLNLINNQNQQSKVFPNGFFTTSSQINGNVQNEFETKKDYVKPNKEISDLNKNGENEKFESKTNLVNMNTNYTQNQIINNIITINNNYNKSKHQFAVVNDSKNNLNQANDKSTIPMTKSKTDLTNVYINHKGSHDVKSKNNLDKNLLTLITNNNINKMLNQNIATSNIPINKVNFIPRSEITKINPLIDKIDLEIRENKNLKIQKHGIKDLHEPLKTTSLENKDSSELIIEKGTNINLIKNIDNNFNNIYAINKKTNKENQKNEDKKHVLRAIQNNLNNNFIKLNNKNLDLNRKDDEKNLIRKNSKIFRNQMSPSYDSDRTIVQFYEKIINLDKMQMNCLLVENYELYPEVKSSKADNFKSIINHPNVLM
jgi:hypothetical protein